MCRVWGLATNEKLRAAWCLSPRKQSLWDIPLILKSKRGGPVECILIPYWFNAILVSADYPTKGILAIWRLHCSLNFTDRAVTRIHFNIVLFVIFLSSLSFSADWWRIITRCKTLGICCRCLLWSQQSKSKELFYISVILTIFSKWIGNVSSFCQNNAITIICFSQHWPWLTSIVRLLSD